MSNFHGINCKRRKQQGLKQRSLHEAMEEMATGKNYYSYAAAVGRKERKKATILLLSPRNENGCVNHHRGASDPLTRNGIVHHLTDKSSLIESQTKGHIAPNFVMKGVLSDLAERGIDPQRGCGHHLYFLKRSKRRLSIKLVHSQPSLAELHFVHELSARRGFDYND
eukprot:scaffold694_cov108-Cylindrotheca_fusiformis.AAC.1